MTTSISSLFISARHYFVNTILVRSAVKTFNTENYWSHGISKMWSTISAPLIIDEDINKFRWRFQFLKNKKLLNFQYLCHLSFINSVGIKKNSLNSHVYWNALYLPWNFKLKSGFIWIIYLCNLKIFYQSLPILMNVFSYKIKFV